MSKLVLIRHGESVWNLENRFTGWMDVPLSSKGFEEARLAGQKLHGYKFDKVYISHLTRSVQTWHNIYLNMNEERIPIVYHYDDGEITLWEHHTGNKNTELEIIQTKLIAERYYGDLQGLNKKETAEKYGEEQVHLWRRSFDIPPPNGESLKDCLARVLPFFNQEICDNLLKGKNVLIVAHGNSLRAIIKKLENISDEEIPKLEIPTGIPIEYELDNNLQIINKIIHNK